MPICITNVLDSGKPASANLLLEKVTCHHNKNEYLEARKMEEKEKLLKKNNTYFSNLPLVADTEYIPTGRVLGDGSFAKAIEVIHIPTGVHYVAKVMTADRLRGYETGVAKEIDVMLTYSRYLKKMEGTSEDKKDVKEDSIKEKEIKERIEESSFLSKSLPSHHLLHLVDGFRILDEVTGEIHLCLILDLCNTDDLFDLICDNGCLTETEAKRIVKAILVGLATLHALGIVHRDVKAENVLFLKDEPVLADFGLAEYCAPGTSKLTEYCGTPGTTAPEIMKNEPYGAACDVYSMGALAYFLLAGYRPFDWARTPREERDAALEGKYYFIEESFKDISAEAKSFIDACMATDPKKRPTAEEALHHPWLE